MINKIYIYVFINVTPGPEYGFMYIGITIDPDRRCVQHLNADSLFGNKVRKYDFDFEILESVDSWEEAFKAEKYYIKELNTQWPNGYNITPGGDGNGGCLKGKKLSPEHIEKIRKAALKHYEEHPETIEKLRKAALKHYEEHPESIQKRMETKRRNGNDKHSQETREKIRRGNTGKKLSPETIEKRNRTRRINKAIQEMEKLDQECFPVV